MTQQYIQSDQYFDRSIVPFIRHARSPSSENVIEHGVQDMKVAMTKDSNKQLIQSTKHADEPHIDDSIDLLERPVSLRKYSSDEEATSPMDEHEEHSHTDSGSFDDSVSTFSDIASISESLLSFTDYSEEEEDCATVEIVEFIAAGKPKVISVPASPVTLDFPQKAYPPLFDDDDHPQIREDRLSLEEECFIWPSIPPRHSSRGPPRATAMDHRYATVYRPLVQPPNAASPNRYYGFELPHLASNEPRTRSSIIKSVPHKEPRASPSLSSLHSASTPSITNKISRTTSLRAKFAPSFLNRLSKSNSSEPERSASLDIDSRDSIYEIPEYEAVSPARPKMIARGASERVPAGSAVPYTTKYDAILEWDEGTEYNPMPMRSASMSQGKTSAERKRRSVGSMLSIMR